MNPFILNSFVWTLTLFHWKTKMHKGKKNQRLTYYEFVKTFFETWKVKSFQHVISLLWISLVELWPCSSGKQNCTKVKNYLLLFFDRELALAVLYMIFCPPFCTIICLLYHYLFNSQFCTIICSILNFVPLFV